MTADLKAAAQQAFNLLDRLPINEGYHDETVEVLDALRAGLAAQPQADAAAGGELPPLPPVTWPSNVGVPSWTAEEVQAYARAAIRAAQPQAEAWRHLRDEAKEAVERAREIKALGAEITAPAEGDCRPCGGMGIGPAGDPCGDCAGTGQPQPKGTLPGWVAEAMQEALSVCDSVCMSRDRRVVREGCVLYMQTEEWCQWAEQEVAPKMRAALAAVSHAAEAATPPPAPAPIPVEGPVNPGETHLRYRLRNPGESLEHYRIAMGWDKQTDAPSSAVQDGWRPIETAPMDGTPFWGWRPRGRTQQGVAYRVPRDDCEMWYFAGSSAAVDIAPDLKPAYWRPLPADPVLDVPVQPTGGQ